jgi:hypothetical protein
MDSDMLTGYSYLGASVLLPLLIPLGIYIITKRVLNKYYLWVGVTCITIGILTFPLWSMGLLFGYMLMSGASFT